MFNSLFGASLFGASSSLHFASIVKRLVVPVVGVTLTTGFAIITNADLAAYSSEVLGNSPVQSAPNLAKQDSAEGDSIATDTNRLASEPIEDGVYLYGQSAERDQIGSAYMVFEVEQGQVIGAFYMPRSSFDCFYGNLEADHLALTVIDSYERTPHPYAVALEPADSLATTEAETTPVRLEGFHAIENPSEADLEILSTCQSDFQ